MDMLRDGSHAAIVRSVIDLAHNLGFEVVAEGVETEQILAEPDRARVRHCAGGTCWPCPMAADRLPQWLLIHQPPVLAAPGGANRARAGLDIPAS